ncbi:MAG: CidA/LrgA family protein [Synergistaceae bacterium]|nr:CidA/LrgA family protein [Synergistaceae bacterium]
MKHLKQYGIIAAVTFAGEAVKYFVPLPVPGSIYGLLILLALLMSGILKLEAVKEAADFLIEIMPVMFIPAAAGLVVSWSALSKMLAPVCVIVVVSTFVVMVVTGKVTDWLMDRNTKEAE